MVYSLSKQQLKSAEAMARGAEEEKEQFDNEIAHLAYPEDASKATITGSTITDSEGEFYEDSD